MILPALSAALVLYAAPGNSHPLRIEYQAPEGCPVSASWWGRISARLPDLITPPPDAPAYRARLEVRRMDSGFSGRLELVDPQGLVSVRQLEADTCEEVVDASSVIVSVFVAAPPSMSPPPEVVRPPPAEPSFPWSYSLHLQGGVRGEVAPRPAPSLSVELFARRPSPRWWSWAFGAGAGYSAAWVRQPEASLLLHAASARLRTCPSRWAPFGEERLELRGCLSMELGAHWGHWLSGDRSWRGGPWIASGVGLRAQLPLAHGWSLQGEGSAQVPWVQNRFQVGETILFSMPSVGWSAQLGVGLHLW